MRDSWSERYHRENGGENANFLGLRGNVVVPIVVGGEEVKHELLHLLALDSNATIPRKLTIRFITAYCWPRQ